MSELTELTQLMQQDPKQVEAILRANPKLREAVRQLDDENRASERVSAGGFAVYYEAQYERELPYVFHDVAEELSWAFHNRKGVVFEGFRGMGKSTFFAAWCPYVMGVNLVGSTALIRINDAAAKAMSKTISDIIQGNLGWKRIFPHVVPDERAGWSVENGFEVMNLKVTGASNSAGFEQGYAKWRMMCLANQWLTVMKCPYCAEPNTQVVDTRENEDGDTVRRRRRCLSCDKRFTTYERVELQLPQVVKKNGSRTDYDRDKLKASMMLAMRKRPVTTESIDLALDRIEEKLVQLALREVASDRIGELVMRELKKLDKVAYIRYASVYRNFEDVDEFSDAIREIKKPRQPRARS